MWQSIKLRVFSFWGTTWNLRLKVGKQAFEIRSCFIWAFKFTCTIPFRILQKTWKNKDYLYFKLQIKIKKFTTSTKGMLLLRTELFICQLICILKSPKKHNVVNKWSFHNIKSFHHESKPKLIDLTVEWRHCGRGNVVGYRRGNTRWYGDGCDMNVFYK